MARVPRLRSFQQIFREMSRAFVGGTGVNDLNTASSNRRFLEVAALSDFRSQSDIISVLNSQNIDNIGGEDLDQEGRKRDVLRPQARVASGVVTIFERNFNKVSSNIFIGTAAPPAGSTIINISNGSNFPATGEVYLGRGTANLEGPIEYSSVTQVGSHWQIQLTSPTTRNHNTGESVVLAQGGNRLVTVGTTVQTPQNSTSPSIKFRTLKTVTVPDGEAQITGVPVAANEIGAKGNVPSGSIRQFATNPFPNAGVTNPSSFVSGRDKMADEEYRDLIKNTEQTRTKATELAIEQAATGVTSQVDNKTTTSARLRAAPDRSKPAILFIDDSTAFQPTFGGQGFESIIDRANGGERFFSLENTDITKALVETTFNAPFSLTGGMRLSVVVGGVVSEHVFASDDFSTPNSADSFEVVNSINKNTNLLFSARLSDNSRKVVLFAKDFVNDDLQVRTPSQGTNANAFLGFSTNLTFSLRLYKNDELLFKDGVIPTLFTNPQADWSPTIASGDTLDLRVDQTPVITYTFLDSDFVDAAGVPTVSNTNSLESWVKVINNKIPGVTASVSDNKIKLESNKGADNNALLEITGGSLVNKSMFDGSSVLLSEGKAQDYFFNNSTGDVELSEFLDNGDQLTAGSKNTRAFVDSKRVPTGTLNLTDPSKMWFIVDADAESVNHGAESGTNIDITNPSANTWRYTSSVSTAFSNVQKDDIVVIAEPNLSDNNLGFFRVNEVSGSFFEIRRVNGTVESTSVSTDLSFFFVRSVNGLIQEAELPNGQQSLSEIASSIESQIEGINTSILNGRIIRISSNTFKEDEGSIFIAGFNLNANDLGFELFDNDISTTSHVGFNESDNNETPFIEFRHDSITSGDSTDPFDDFDTNDDLEAESIQPNTFIQFLNPYQSDININRNIKGFIRKLNSNNVRIRENNRLGDIITSDRYHVMSPFDFNVEDDLVAIIDKNAADSSLSIPIARNGRINNEDSPTSTKFTANDIDLGPTANWSSSFGDNFDFSDFKIHFKAREVFEPSGAENDLLIRSAFYGPTGNKLRVGIFFPNSPNSGLSSAVTVGENTNISIFLASGSSRTGGAWDSSTQFDVVNTTGDIYRYTWNNNGTAPDFVNGASVAVGDIIKIAESSDFNINNEGIFKVVGVSDNYFEVENPNGVIESNIELNSAGELLFYELDSGANTAQGVGDFIGSDLSDYIEAEQLNDGSGEISTTTFMDSGSDFKELKDGENWILSSNIGTTSTPENEFTLKEPLVVSGSTYSLVGEEFFLIPVKANSISNYLSNFSVTALDSIANQSLSDQTSRLQLFSDNFGSASAIQVTGGRANNTSGVVTVNATTVDSNFTKFSINTANRSGFHANQWIKIENTSTQTKVTGFDETTEIELTGNYLGNLDQTKVDITSGAGTFRTARTHGGDNTTELRVERHGRFTNISFTGTGQSTNFSSNIEEGDWVIIDGNFSEQNKGTFRVIKVFEDSFYVENDASLNEDVTLSANDDLVFLSYDSVIIGDVFEISTNVLGGDNQGQFSVVDVLSSTSIVVEGDPVTNQSPTVLGDDFTRVNIIEGTPFFLYSKIHNIGVSPVNPNFVNVITKGTTLFTKINTSAGSGIQATSKFNFNTNVNTGEDSYKFYRGLIKSVGDVIRGREDDPITFSGVKAAGSFIVPDAPLPKRIQVSISIRNRTGTPFSVIRSRVQSAVASYINSVNVGQPVIFSEMISAANSVNGVQAVSIISPDFDVNNDQILSQPNEKPIVVNANEDVIISLAT